MPPGLRPKLTRAPHSVVVCFGHRRLVSGPFHNDGDAPRAPRRDASTAECQRNYETGHQVAGQRGNREEGVMRSVPRSLSTVLTVAAIVFVPTVLGRGVVAGQGSASSASSSMNDRARFVGTYELVTTEVKDPATGKWSSTPHFNSNGYIIYAETGHMGVHIQPKVRARFAANAPTAEEAQAALLGYTAYFGSFTVNDKEKEKFVVHH